MKKLMDIPNGGARSEIKFIGPGEKNSAIVDWLNRRERGIKLQLRIL